MSKLTDATESFRVAVGDMFGYVGTPCDKQVYLDGEFTIAELEVVVAALKKYNADKA